MKRGGPLKRKTPLRQVGRGRGAKEILWTRCKNEVRHRCGGRCEANITGCTVRMDHVHHLLPRSQGGKDDASGCIGVCWSCHRWIHDNPARARALGLLWTKEAPCG